MQHFRAEVVESVDFVSVHIYLNLTVSVISRDAKLMEPIGVNEKYIIYICIIIMMTCGLNIVFYLCNSPIGAMCQPLCSTHVYDYSLC